nr:hypothetical protein [Lachnospiraceae bacterium]
MYNKPKVIELDNLAEGIFAASGGGSVITEEESAYTPKCDSKYIKGNFVSPDYSQWAAAATCSENTFRKIIKLYNLRFVIHNFLLHKAIKYNLLLK